MLFSVLFHSHVFSWFLVRFMVSGTLKIHQNQWRVVQNQGSLKNVKVASEVAPRVNFNAILEAFLLPKLIFLSKKKLLEISPKKEPPQVSNKFGAGQTESRMAPRKPPLAHALFQTRNNCLSNCWALFWICCEKTGVGAKKVKRLLKKSKVRSSW